ncbi:MAG: amidohydrolase family protein [Longimicrobiales bacterium]|jgi:imidazolonepropionase-like amidohydrolase|nr:amidohydrolase family protein [Longimicrobiales bacterium]
MNISRLFPVLVLSALVAACSTSAPGSSTTAFSGATVWDGSGATAVPNTTLFVREGRIVGMSSDGSVPEGADVTETVDLSGRYVIPGLINAHGHVSGLWADESVVNEVDRVRGDLELFARYGVTTVNSLGDTDAVLAARDQATPTDPRARLFVAGPVIAASDPEQAHADAQANVESGVDWLKLRVDDNLGTVAKMPWDAIQAVLDVAEENDVRLATHLFYLDDAKRLLEMGSSMVAHSVRDVDVDDEFLGQLRETGVCYVPTLTREVSTFVYGERPDFFDDPFFTEYAHAGEVARVSEPAFMERMASSPAAAGYRVALEQALLNVKAISDARLQVAMGTDAGPAGRFPGYFEHMELWMMGHAGMTPEQVLMSATSVAASCLDLGDRGVLAPGMWADFMVLTENPLDDLENTRSLEQVYVAGQPVR